MKDAIRSVLLCSLIAVGAGACTVDLDPTTGVCQYSCASDADCLTGFICEIDDGQAVGCCLIFDDGYECEDADNDSFLAGPDCTVTSQLDCDDTNPNINPGEDEDCNNIDDNCNDMIDEDINAQPCPLQFGVCAGAVRQCVNGAFEDCIADGLYGENFENVAASAESCDGLDNNCDCRTCDESSTPLEVDAHCTPDQGRCLPGATPPSACNTDIGICERGIRFCRDDATVTDCIVADLGATSCTSDAECGTNGFCVEETLDPREDISDGCSLQASPSCQRSVCRVLSGTTACTTGGSECGLTEVCESGFCQPLAATNEAEVCDGEDDNCDGRIDDNACDRCPYGMQVVAVGGIDTCIDRYEASRPDATSGNAGTLELYARSQMGVLPWTGVVRDAAETACSGAGINDIISGAVPRRRLCTGTELQAACLTTELTVGNCVDVTNGGPGLATSGSVSGCCITHGADHNPDFEDPIICDIVGNAGEHVPGPFAGIFGGAATDSAAEVLSCDPTVVGRTDPPYNRDVPSGVQGFRCCMFPLN